MKRPFARLFEVDGEHVVCYVDSVENSEDETCWGIITQFISEGGNVAKLQFAYAPEVEIEEVLSHLFNTENDEIFIDNTRKTLKTLRSFEV